MYNVTDHFKNQNDKILGSYNDEGASFLKSQEIEEIAKGRKAEAIGTKKTYGGKDYIKTANGWKPVGKNSGAAKQAHDFVHGKKENSKFIELTGKETKEDLINKLVAAKPNFERSERHSAAYYKNDSKGELLKLVKVYNANIAGGGNGNISTFSNEEAHSHLHEVNDRIKDYIKNEYGIEFDDIKNHINQKDGLELANKWKEHLNSEHNGIVGHTEEEKDKAYNKLKELFDSKLNKDSFDESKLKITDQIQPYQGNKDAKWVRVEYSNGKDTLIAGMAIDKFGSKQKALEAAIEKIKSDLKNK